MSLIDLSSVVVSRVPSKVSPLYCMQLGMMQENAVDW